MHAWLAVNHNFLPKLCFHPPENLGPRFGRYLRALLYLFNLHTLSLGFLACLAVYVCDRYHFSYNMDLTLVATGTTFPLIFNIQQAFGRREKALSLIANLKASAVSLYFMHRDWAQDEGFPASLGNDHNVAAVQCKALLMDLLKDVRAYLVANSPWESYAEQRLQAKTHPYVNMLMADMSLSGADQVSFNAAVEHSQKADPATAALRRCYRGFSRLSVLNERLGLRCGYTKGGEGGMSRTNQYLRYIISNLEELRMIREYRTPIMMRYANGVLLHIFAIFLAPYFVHFCDSWVNMGYSRGSCPAGYSAAIAFVVIVLLLYHVQQDIENPFDMDGLDDVFFDVGNEVMDDVIHPYTTGTAASSGWTTPRHPAASAPEVHVASNGNGSPGPFNPRGVAELHGICRLVPQGSLLQSVTEDLQGLGGDDFAAGPFASVGFSGPIGNMPRAGSSRLARPPSGPLDAVAFLSKQQLQSGCGGSAAGGSSPLRSWVPPYAGSQDEEMPRISSNGSMEMIQRASSVRRRSGAGVATERSRGSAVELGSLSPRQPFQEGKNSNSVSDMGEDTAATAAISSPGIRSMHERVLDRSDSSNNSREGLISPGSYSSPWQ